VHHDPEARRPILWFSRQWRFARRRTKRGLTNAYREPLADTPQLNDSRAGERRRRWIDRPQYERLRDLEPLEGLPEDAWAERFQIRGEIGELGHERGV